MRARALCRWVGSLLLLAAAASHAQVLGPVLKLEAPTAWASDLDQTFPAATWAGDGYVIAWQDARDGRSADLWAAKVDPLGRAVTHRNLPLLREPGSQTRPAVAASPSTVLVVALDGVACGAELLALPLDLSLTPRAASARLTTSACTADAPAIAWSDAASRFLVTWGRHGAGAELHGALLDASGQVVLPDFVISTAANTAQTPAVVAAAGGFVVAFADDRLQSGRPNIYAVTVSSAGAIGTPAQVSPAAVAQSSPCIATAGAALLVGYVESGAITAQTLDAALQPSGAPIAVATGAAGAVNRPACAEIAPGQVAIAYEETLTGGPGASMAVVNAGSVTPLGPVLPRAGYFNRGQPRVAAGGGSAVVVAHGQTTYIDENDVLLRAIDLAGQPLPSDGGVVLLSTSAAPQERVVGAWNGERYLAVWNDHGRFTSYEIMGQLVEPGTGRLLAGDAGLTLSAGSHNLGSPVAAAAEPDGGFWLSWGDVGSAGSLMGRTVSPQGTGGGWLKLNDVSSYVSQHASTWFGDAFVTLSLKSDTLRVRRTSRATVTLQPETVLLDTAPGAAQLAVASWGDVLLAVFPGLDAGVDLHAVRLDPDGGLLDASPLAVSSQPGNEADPAVAAGGGVFLVAWSAALDGGTSTSAARGVFVARVSPQGVLLDEPPLALGPGTQPSVGWWGTEFLVAWSSSSEDVVGVRVDPTGQPRDAAPFPLVATAEIDRRPGVTSGPAGEVLLTWESYEPQEPFQTFRAQARLLLNHDAPDASVADAGSADGGGEDGGHLTDAGTSADGGAGQPDPRAPLVLRVGFGCAAAPGDAAWLGLACFAWAARRRARPARRQGSVSASSSRGAPSPLPGT